MSTQPLTNYVLNLFLEEININMYLHFIHVIDI